MTHKTDASSETAPPVDNPSAGNPHRVSPLGASQGQNMPPYQVAALALSGTGLVLSLVLEQLHVQTHLVPNSSHFCSLTSTFDCAAVAASPHALFLGIPWAIWGALGYLAMGVASFRRSLWLLPLAGVAALVSLSLFLLSVFSIRSVCLLCEAVHLVSVALLVTAYRARHQLKDDLRDVTSARLIIGVPAALAVFVFIALPPYWSAFSYKADPPFPTGKTAEGKHWIGSREPDVTIHEYVNYRCPFCKIGSARLLRELGMNSNWRIVRHPISPGGCPEGTIHTCHEERMAHCAGEQGKFWRADRWLFAHAHNTKRVNKDYMVRDLELDTSPFESCYSSAATMQLLDTHHKESRSKGISGVPDYDIEAKGEIPAALKPLAERAAQRTNKNKK